MKAIEIESLWKRYGRHVAVRDLTFRVPAGEMIGFLGPNGAGKTTAIRVLMGLLKATSGKARVLGVPCWRRGHTVRHRVGYLPGEVRLYDGWTGEQTVRFFARALKLPDASEPNRLAERFSLDLSRRVRDYSRGMRQKLGIIVCMMHQPELLILDEPSTGLDPLMSQVLYEELRHVVADGRTVLFSSHLLSEVEELCERVVILRDGRLVAFESMQRLRDAAPRRVTLRYDDAPVPTHSFPPELHVDRKKDDELLGRWHGPLSELLTWLQAHPPADFAIMPPDLEDVFLAYYRDMESPS